MKVVTRFAPSPTGYLHLGGARTALFNWMYSKKYSGKFLLRVENTDQNRSNNKAESAILTGLEWLGLHWDDEVIYQFDRKERHLEIAQSLLERNLAYKCYATKEEIYNFKVNAVQLKKSTKFVSPWRDQQSIKPTTKDYVVRLRVPDFGQTEFRDTVQGIVAWKNQNLDDLILLRSDGTATYNLAVVVDDHDFNITHIIRGDDHLTNAARQYLIYAALDWKVPVFSHIPLIHGSDGKKLSKRHGAIGLDYYQKKGIKASAMINYLAQLGWESGKNDLIPIGEMIEKFEIGRIVRSPARFDPTKLNDICSKLIRSSDEATVIKEFDAFLHVAGIAPLKKDEKAILRSSLPFLKTRATNYKDLYDQAHSLIKRDHFKIEASCFELITSQSLSLLRELTIRLIDATWEREKVNEIIKLFAKEQKVPFKDVAQMVRIALVGKLNAPGIIDMMLALGKSEVIERFDNLYGMKSSEV